MRRGLGIGLLVGALLGISVAAAQKPMAEPKEMSSSYNPLLWRGDDALFVLDTVQMSRSEVELSKLAIVKSSDTAVQNLALVLVRDQGKVNHTLTSWSRTYGFALPKQEDAQMASAEDRLKELNGAEFERAYLELMAKDNAADVSRFQTEIHTAVDHDLAKFAGKYLPKLQADGQLLPVRGTHDKKTGR